MQSDSYTTEILNERLSLCREKFCALCQIGQYIGLPKDMIDVIGYNLLHLILWASQKVFDKECLDGIFRVKAIEMSNLMEPGSFRAVITLMTMTKSTFTLTSFYGVGDDGYGSYERHIIIYAEHIVIKAVDSSSEHIDRNRVIEVEKRIDEHLLKCESIVGSYTGEIFYIHRDMTQFDKVCEGLTEIRMGKHTTYIPDITLVDYTKQDFIDMAMDSFVMSCVRPGKMLLTLEMSGAHGNEEARLYRESFQSTVVKVELNSGDKYMDTGTTRFKLKWSCGGDNDGDNQFIQTLATWIQIMKHYKTSGVSTGPLPNVQFYQLSGRGDLQPPMRAWIVRK